MNNDLSFLQGFISTIERRLLLTRTKENEIYRLKWYTRKFTGSDGDEISGLFVGVFKTVKQDNKKYKSEHLGSVMLPSIHLRVLIKAMKKLANHTLENELFLTKTSNVYINNQKTDKLVKKGGLGIRKKSVQTKTGEAIINFLVFIDKNGVEYSFPLYPNNYGTVTYTNSKGEPLTDKSEISNLYMEAYASCLEEWLSNNPEYITSLLDSNQLKSNNNFKDELEFAKKKDNVEKSPENALESDIDNTSNTSVEDVDIDDLI